MTLFHDHRGRLCPVRLFGIGFAFLTATSYLGLAAWSVVHQGRALDYVGFGTGAGLIWTAASAAIIGKQYVEDKRDATQEGS